MIDDAKLRALLEDIAARETQYGGNLPYFSLYVEDFLFGTRRFTAEARGVYIALLCSQWQQGSLPQDHDKLAQIAEVTPKKFARLWELRLADKFVAYGERYYNVRGLKTRLAALKNALRASRKQPTAHGGAKPFH